MTPAVVTFTKEVNPRLAKRPLKTNGRLANRGLTSLVQEATEYKSFFYQMTCVSCLYMEQPRSVNSIQLSSLYSF